MFDHIGIFYRGLVLGLAVAAPVGPVGLMCIRRTLVKGLIIGFATGLGAACADTIFSTIAVVGVTAILEFIHHYSDIIHFIGGLILLTMAIYTWRDRPEALPKEGRFATRLITMAASANWLDSLQAYITGLIITLTNPLTLFAVMAVVATFSGLKKHAEGGILVSGIFCGSTLWWIILSGGVAAVRSHFTESRIIVVNRVTAALLAALAAWAILSGVKGLLNYSAN